MTNKQPAGRLNPASTHVFGGDGQKGVFLYLHSTFIDRGIIKNKTMESQLYDLLLTDLGSNTFKSI